MPQVSTLFMEILNEDGAREEGEWAIISFMCEVLFDLKGRWLSVASKDIDLSQEEGIPSSRVKRSWNHPKLHKEWKVANIICF